MVLHGLFCIFHGNGLLFVLGFVILAYSTSQLIRNLRLLKSQYEGVSRFTQLTAVDTDYVHTKQGNSGAPHKAICQWQCVDVD